MSKLWDNELRFDDPDRAPQEHPFEGYLLALSIVMLFFWIPLVCLIWQWLE